MNKSIISKLTFNDLDYNTRIPNGYTDNNIYSKLKWDSNNTPTVINSNNIKVMQIKTNTDRIHITQAFTNSASIIDSEWEVEANIKILTLNSYNGYFGWTNQHGKYLGIYIRNSFKGGLSLTSTGGKEVSFNYKFEANKEYNIIVSYIAYNFRLIINGEHIGVVDGKEFIKSLSSTNTLLMMFGSADGSSTDAMTNGLLWNMNVSLGGGVKNEDPSNLTKYGTNLLSRLNFDNLAILGTANISVAGLESVMNSAVTWNYDSTKINNYTVNTTFTTNINNNFTANIKFSNNRNRKDVDLITYGNYKVTYNYISIGEPEPIVVVDSYTKSALDFENGLVDKIPTTVWNKEGSASVTTANKIFGDNSFETKALGDSLYTNSNIITGGSTPFTIEFYALIKPQETQLYTEGLVITDNRILSIDKTTRNLMYSVGNSLGKIKIKYNELNKIMITFDGATTRVFVNDILDIVVGINTGIASTIYSFLSKVDVHWDKVVSLLNFDGDLTDETGETWTAKNSPTYTAGVFNNAIKLQSSSKQCVYSSNGIADFSSSDFTVEFFINFQSFNAGACVLTGGWNYSAGKRTWGFLLGEGSDLNKLHFYCSTNGSTSYICSIKGHTLSTNTTYHVAAVREGSTFRLFLNGVLVGTSTSSASIYSDLSSGVTVGSYSQSEANSSYYVNAWFDEIRITKGVARYTENFTPPTEPFPPNAFFTKGLIDNINIHDGIATKVRDHDPYEEFLVVDLAFDGENNSTKIVDNARLNERNEIKYNDNVVALLHFDGNIDDEVSNVWNSNNSYYSINSSEILLNNTNLVLNGDSQIYNTSLPQLGNEYTIECFIKHPSSSSTSTKREGIFSTNNNSGLYFNTYNDLTLYISTAKASAAISHDSVHHIALVAKNGNTNVFVDGILTLSSNSVLDATTSLYIGSGVNREYYTGRIDEFRITKGIARYTENFTPPTEPFNYVKHIKWTVNGNAKISTDQKFDGFSSLKNNRDGYIISNTQPITSSDISTISFEFYIESINNDNVYYDTYDGTYNNTFQLLNYGGKFSLWYSNITVQIATLENQSKNKITFIYNSRNVKVYVNGYLKLDTTLDIDLNFGNKFALFGQGVYPNPSYYSDGYFKNFKIYKGVAVIPEDPTGKIQLDFDNNLVDKYGNSTWTNNGVTFDQVNSVKGYSAYFDGNAIGIKSGINNNLNFENKNFIIDFDFKAIELGRQYSSRIITSEQVGSYNPFTVSIPNGSTSISVNTTNDSMTGWGVSLYSDGTTILTNDYRNICVSRINNNFMLKDNGVLRSIANINTTQSLFNLNAGNNTIIGTNRYDIDGTKFKGYIDNFKSTKNPQESVIIDQPAVHLPLETNAINTGFTGLTINSVGNPTYTTIDGKKCIKFESGKYLTINSNNIFNLGTNSDFYIEFDFYPLVDKYHHLISAGSNVAELITIAMSHGGSADGNSVYVYAGGVYLLTTEGIMWDLNKFNNIKLYRKGTLVTLSVNGHTFTTTTSSNFDFSKSYTTIGEPQFNAGSYCDGYMSNFKMFVGTSEIPETYNDKKVLDLDFKPTGKSYLFKDNNNKCVIHPVNITQRDYQDSQYCCSFNGTNQYLQLGKNDLFNFGLDDFIFKFKFKINDFTKKYCRLFADGNSNDVSYTAICGDSHPYPQNRRKLLFIIDDVSGIYLQTINPLVENTIYDVLVVREGSSIRMFIDGVMVDEIITTLQYNLNGNNNTLIGSHNRDALDISNKTFNGTIYSLKVLRNTTDLTLLDEVASKFEESFTLSNGTDSQTILNDVKKDNHNIRFIKDTDKSKLIIDGEFVEVPSVENTSNELKLFDNYNSDVNDVKLYNTVFEDEDIFLGSEPLDTQFGEIEYYEESMYELEIPEGDYTLSGFIEGYIDREFFIYNTFLNYEIFRGTEYYDINGMNKYSLDDYEINDLVSGEKYKVLTHEMIKGFISGAVNLKNCGVTSNNMEVFCYRSDNYRHIGTYSVDKDGKYVIPNLDVNSRYDIIFRDKTKKIKDQISNYRKPMKY